MPVASPSVPAVKDTGRISIVSVGNDIGSGASVDLIPAAANKAGLLLWTSTLSSSAAAQNTAGFNSQDQIIDDAGVPYNTCQVAIPPTAASVSAADSDTSFMDHQGIEVPAGRAVKLVNGGASGTTALRHCSAVLTYTALV